MSRRRVLLIGWDAADWKILNPLIEKSEMPTFGRLVEQGTIADMVTLEPPLSPMLWNSIATGKLADQHGILGFTEVHPVSGRVQPVSSLSRRTKALWNILSQNNLRTNVVGWFGGHPAEPIRGACVSDAFARGFPRGDKPWRMLRGTVWPEAIADELAGLRVRPQEIDEEIYRLFIPRLDEVDRSRPNPLSMLGNVLAECFTTHAAATHLIERCDWDFMAVYYIGIDHFSHGFINFHPPKPDWVSQKDFDLYHDVVNSGYRLMDLFLSRMLQLAGPETTVVVISDHGFHSDHLRPARILRVPTGPAMQHRPLGVFAIAGAGIRRDERIYGANLLDVAPTILSLFGLPAGEDMPGRVLVEAFESTPALRRIPSWDGVEGESGSHPASYQTEPEIADELVEQFIALGYLEARPFEGARAVAECRRESKWNLARVYTGSWRFEMGMPLLEELRMEWPERIDFALGLADCQLRLGLFEEAEVTIQQVIRQRPDSPMAHYFRGKVAFERHQYRDSLSHFLTAEKLKPHFPELYIDLGLAYAKLRRWIDAERTLEKALVLDPDSALALQALAGVLFRQGRAEDAAERALASIARRHDLALSHFWLGIALNRLGNQKRAIQAFEASLSFVPPLRIAHRMLAILRQGTSEGEGHRQLAKDALRRRHEELRRLERSRREIRRRMIQRVEIESPEACTPGHGEPPLEFVVVSGLPRSGTSLMMQMLEAGGLAVMTDGERRRDEDNPEGYYEWEEIKRVGAEPDIMRRAEGKAIKVISMLLPSLPMEHHYKIIFMDRPIREVVTSQIKMARKRGKQVDNPENLAEMLEDHRTRILLGIKNTPNFSLLVVDYPQLIKSPAEWSHRIRSFLGEVAGWEAMIRAVRPELYRNRESG